MDEPAPPGEYSHMGHPVGPACPEKNQVASPEITASNRCAHGELGAGGAGQFEAHQVVNGHGQSAAVETVFRRNAAPPVGDAQIAFGPLDDGVPDIAGAPCGLPVHGVSLGADDEEILEDPPGAEPLRLTPGGPLVLEISEPDLVEPGFVPEIVGVDAEFVQGASEPHGVVQAAEGPDLDGESRADLGRLRRCGRHAGGYGRPTGAARGPEDGQEDGDCPEETALAVPVSHDESCCLCDAG